MYCCERLFFKVIRVSPFTRSIRGGPSRITVSCPLDGSFELIVPERSEGNQRRYSRDDIDRVNEIVGLVDEGLTLSGVRRVIELQAEVDALKAEIKSLRRRQS